MTVVETGEQRDLAAGVDPELQSMLDDSATGSRRARRKTPKTWQEIATPLVLILAVLTFLWQMETGFNAIDGQLVGLRQEMQAGDRSLREETLAGQERLRQEMLAGQEALRQSLREEILAGQEAIRQEMRRELSDIRSVQLEMFERLSRIEGFLGIGMPEDAAARAPGAHYRATASASTATLHAQLLLP